MEITVPSECWQRRSSDRYEKSHGKIEKSKNEFVENYISENSRDLLMPEMGHNGKNTIKK